MLDQPGRGWVGCFVNHDGWVTVQVIMPCGRSEAITASELEDGEVGGRLVEHRLRLQPAPNRVFAKRDRCVTEESCLGQTTAIRECSPADRRDAVGDSHARQATASKNTSLPIVVTLLGME